jgi:hypothetical protein
MNEHYTSIGQTSIGQPVPAHSIYDTAILHPDGAFFALLCLGSWMLFFWLWAWNHKPKRRARWDLRHMERQWKHDNEHWKN